MTYDPFKHHRRSIRLEGYDYTQAGAYFVTIVTRNRDCLFDDPGLRHVAEAYWLAIPLHFQAVILDEWIVMPNHLHGILVIDGPGGAAPSVPRQSARPSTYARGPRSAGHSAKSSTGAIPGSLGAIIGNFKSVSARRINAIRKMTGAAVWRRNYCEHIGRDEKELRRVRQYIVDNPALWGSDEENPHFPS